MDSQQRSAKAEVKAVLKAKNPSIGQRIDREEIERPLLQKGIPAFSIQDAIHILMSEGFLERYTEHPDKNWFSDLKVTVLGSTNWLNKVIEPRQFRLEVLKTYYELSGGGTMTPVMRTVVAVSLGITDYNDSKLLNAIYFLVDKGFLKMVDNMDESITTSGVEEVENNAPTLFGNLIPQSVPRAVDADPYKEAKELVEKIKELMIAVATGTSIKDKNGEYKALYAELDSELVQQGVENPNEFSDLWEFQTYWKANGMGTYAERRSYVVRLYKNIFSRTSKSITKAREFVSGSRIQELKSLSGKVFDLSKLIRFCEELNIAFQNESYFSTALLTRAIIDHVAPIFSKSTFTEVANNHGSKSFKDSMSHLDNSSRKISDAHLHTQIRNKEILPNETQVNFSNDLDVLLAEICRLLK